MKRYAIGFLFALAFLSPLGVEMSATIEHIGAPGTETIVTYAPGKYAHLRNGERVVVHETVDVERMIEFGFGWEHIPIQPKPRLVIRILQAIRPETFAAMMLFPSRRTIMLNVPPAGSVWHEYSGTAQLAGILSQTGHKVIQRKGYIAAVEYTLRKQGGKEIDAALSVIRSRESDILALYGAGKTFERVSMSIPTDDRFSVIRNNINYVSQYHDGTIAGLLAAIKNRERNVFYDYFEQVEVPFARDMQPDICGINASDERQIVPCLVLASMIKEALPRTLVVIGGNYWTRVAHTLRMPAFSEIFDHCDAIVWREGYQPLQQLAETLDPSQCSGVAWRRGQQVVVNMASKTPTDFRTLPTPIFDRNVKQWSPDFVPSLYTASNCYMKCDFCDIGAGSDTFLDTPRAMSPQQIAEHMQQTGAHRFEIFDEMFPIPMQIALGEELRRIGYEATWECYLTITNRLADPRVCEQLYAAGCRAVQLGLESLSTATLAQESKKWNTPANYGRILANLKAAGIQTHVFIIVGIPGQPLHWDLAWTGFIADKGENITTIKSGRWRPSRHAPELQDNKRSEYARILPDTKPAHLNRDAVYLSTSRQKVEAVRDIHEEMCIRHGLYGVTSTIPWHVNRGRYTIDELWQMAKLLPPEPSVRHLDEAIVKSNTILREELGFSGKITSYEDLVSFSRRLL